MGWAAGASAGAVVKKTVTTGSVAGSATAVVTVTWDTPFANTNYVVVAEVLETTAAASLRVDKIQSLSTSAVTVRVTNADAVTARTGTLHLLAVAG